MSEKKEYIERGALIAFVREVRKKLPKDSKDFFTRDEMLLNFQQYLELQKAADVEPVVHVHAVYEDENDTTAHCSNCGIERDFFDKYCPECGGKFESAHMERSGSGE